MFFGNKLFDGVGFPTPSSIPVECAYRLAKLPADAAWLGTFMGLIETLMDEANWQQLDGGITREQAAAVWADIVQGLYDSAETGVVVDVRQNPVDLCTLEKTADGVTWVPFADLQACPPLLTANTHGGITVGVNDPSGFYEFEVPDGPWVNDPPTQWFTDLQPTTGMTKQTNDICTAAANAANFLRHFKDGIGVSLIPSVGGAATAYAEIEGGLALLFGQEFAGFVAIGVSAFFAGLQGVFYTTPFTDADFRAVACLIKDNMTGTAGSWTINFGAVYGGLTGIGLSAGLSGVIQLMLDLIGTNGLSLAAKTTEIATYDCAAVAGDILYWTETFSQYVVSNNQLFSFVPAIGAKAPGVLSLVRFRMVSQHFSSPDGMGGDNTQAIVAGHGAVDGPGPGFVSSTRNDVWLRNNLVYSTNALALAAERIVLSLPTYNPDFQAQMVANPGTFVWPQHRWKVTPLASAVTLAMKVDYYYHVTYPICP